MRKTHAPRTSRPTPEALQRIQRLAAATQDPDPQAIRVAERSIATACGIADHDVDHGLLAQRQSGESDPSGFQATQRFAHTLRSALVPFWDHFNRAHGPRDKFDLALCTPTQFERLWTARRVVDGVHVPYAAYLSAAVGWWMGQAADREPTPGQLTSGEAVLAVVERLSVGQAALQVPAAPAKESGQSVPPGEGTLPPHGQMFPPSTQAGAEGWGNGRPQP